jgi:MoaA/NifB/PqqE/SkfB family radical SAM enzyme
MPADTETPPLPSHLQLEITSACNLRWVMCLVRYRPPVNKLAGAMPLELFERLVGDVPGLHRLTLQGLGEPFVVPAPDAHDPHRGGAARHGRLQHQRDAAHPAAGCRAGGSRVDWVHVSLDGAGAAAYEAVRNGAQFDTVVANLAGLVRAKQAATSSTPWIRIVFVAVRNNVTELPDLLRLLGDLRIDELHVQNLSHSFSDTDAAGRYDAIRAFTADQALWNGVDQQRVRAAFTEARRAAGNSGLRVRLPRTDATPTLTAWSEPGCSWPWEAAYITSAGVVQPCCMVMGNDWVTLGRLDVQSFPEIWRGQPYQEFRRCLSSDEPPSVCRGVPSIGGPSDRARTSRKAHSAIAWIMGATEHRSPGARRDHRG